VISPSQKPLPDNTQQSQDTDIYARGGIQTRISTKQMAVDPDFRQRGYWDRHVYVSTGLGFHELNNAALSHN